MLDPGWFSNGQLVDSTTRGVLNCQGTQPTRRAVAVSRPRTQLVRRLLGLLTCLSLSATSLLVLSAEAAPRVTVAAKVKPLTGQDISWPNCPKGMGIPARRTLGLPMPPASTKFVVIGLTNGPGFYPNPCLKRQVKWAKKHHTYTAPYAFATYPTAKQIKKYGSKGPYKATTTKNKLRNAGYAEAQFNVATMRKAGLTASFVWVDVEASRAPAPWSTAKKRNTAVLDGLVAGYRKAGLRVGFYLTGYQWRTIIGSKHYGLPEWRTVGQVSKASALKMCAKPTIQGGQAVIAQWWDRKADHDVTCPKFSSTTKLKTYFTKY